MEDHNAGSGMHVQAMEELQKRLEDMEKQLANEREKYLASHQEFLTTRDGLNDDIRKLADSLKKSQSERQNDKSLFFPMT